MSNAANLIDPAALAAEVNRIVSAEVVKVLEGIELPSQLTAETMALGVAIVQAMAKTEPFASFGPNIGKKPINVTPSDTKDFADGPSKGLFVGKPGVVEIVGKGGRRATLISGPSQYHPIEAIRVRKTETTAQSIVAFF